MNIISPHLVHPGDKFGRLLVLGYDHNDLRSRRHYLVRCDCGTEKTVQGTLLRTGNTKSCGCHAREMKKATRIPNDRGVINHIILQYRRHAKDRDITWTLSFDEVEALVRSPCHYCGQLAGNLKKTKNHEGFAHNGIDRLDSAKPYVVGNVVACCGQCNRAKGVMSEAEFIGWAKRIADQWGAYLTDNNFASPLLGRLAGAGAGSNPEKSPGSVLSEVKA
jgi:hypothetical protein